MPEALRAHSVPEHPRRPRLRAQQGVSRSASVRADGLHDVAVLVVFVCACFRSSARVQRVQFIFAVLAGIRTIADRIYVCRESSLNVRFNELGLPKETSVFRIYVCRESSLNVRFNELGLPKETYVFQK